MANVLDIRILGDDILRKKLQEVDPKDPFLKDFIPDLIHTMYIRDGVGLAANQVGVDKRIVVIDPHTADEEKEQNPIVMLNPKILERDGKQIGDEGCISVPYIFAPVVRDKKIVYEYTDLEGKTITKETEGYEAVIIQHELDHLDGIVFTDRLAPLAKLKLKTKLSQMESTAVDGVNIRKD
ncbi:MAG: peptide deformylase [Candidatus Cloacimonetes bacterium]|jgi:peptide deformylase|nr:peptide deformylase [Candidatus Cloacimonadota bacterium]